MKLGSAGAGRELNAVRGFERRDFHRFRGFAFKHHSRFFEFCTEAHGTVTLDEKPLPNAQVEIQTRKGTSYGRTDQNGHYVAEYSQGLKGAGKGEAKIRIRTNVTFPDEDTSKLEYDSNTGDYRKEELVPKKYNARSELTVEITDDGAP